jgi:hypothetical protein
MSLVPGRTPADGAVSCDAWGRSAGQGRALRSSARAQSDGWQVDAPPRDCVPRGAAAFRDESRAVAGACADMNPPPRRRTKPPGERPGPARVLFVALAGFDWDTAVVEPLTPWRRRGARRSVEGSSAVETNAAAEAVLGGRVCQRPEPVIADLALHADLLGDSPRFVLQETAATNVAPFAGPGREARFLSALRNTPSLNPHSRGRVSHPFSR